MNTALHRSLFAVAAYSITTVLLIGPVAAKPSADGPTKIVSKQSATVEVQGKLDKGTTMDLAWAAKSSVACFPATENVNFNGKHVLFTTTLPAQTEMTVTVVPKDPKTDLSVYAYSVSASADAPLPPDVSSVVSCEAGYDAQHDNNPGATESVKLTAITNPYNVVIGVAGANGAATGAFTVKVQL